MRYSEIIMKRSVNFSTFRERSIGSDAVVQTPQGIFPLIYADWAASGRLYRPIEEHIQKVFGPWVANTHTETNATGTAMTRSYHEAKHIIKAHVGATDDDALVMAGSGMTSAVVLLQRILGWRVPEAYRGKLTIADADRPLVFVSELEHHSNHTSWTETIADVVVLPQTNTSAVDMQELERLLKQYKNRRIKVAAVTAGSNVTGVRPPIHDIAEVMHHSGGFCFVDYTCAAPYDTITMHPTEARSLDAIYFSPHKFLGGPGAPGVLIFNKKLYKNTVPDRPGGGTVLWTNPWGGKQYYPDIETREDGGTPPFLGTIRAALAVKLKEQMGLRNIARREKELCERFFAGLTGVDGLSILAANHRERLAVFALTIEGLHYNLIARLLNDYYGIQVRGGCACAGTYGHRLFNINREFSRTITDQIDRGNLSNKPGFVRVSLHPTMSDELVDIVIAALKDIAANGQAMAKDYLYDPRANEFRHKNGEVPVFDVAAAFRLPA